MGKELGEEQRDEHKMWEAAHKSSEIGGRGDILNKVTSVLTLGLEHCISETTGF